MSLSFCVLGSGSRGNATLLVHGGRRCLIDAGLSPRMTKQRLAPLGVALEDLDAIVVTHLDTDHFHSGWVRAARTLGLPVHLHERHRARAVRQGLDGRAIALFTGAFEVDGTRFRPELFAHDALGTVGFVIERDGARLGWATDLGRVPAWLPERFAGVHALAIESNYDPDMQRASPRPEQLKRRIMGGRGHLSNEQSLEAVLAIARTTALQHVVTLHLSQQCNTPRHVKRLYTERAGDLLDRLTISTQQIPTGTLRVVADGSSAPPPRVGEQMALF